MKSSRSRRSNSGQVLIVTSLIVMMLLLSAVIYVNEVQKKMPAYSNEGYGKFSAIRQAAVHTVMSALANVSNGGNSSVLVDDLDMLESVAAENFYDSFFAMECTPLNSTPYQDGVYISWDSEGEGVSSMYVSFALNSSGTSRTSHSEYIINLTSAISVNGNYTPLNASLKQVNLTCNVLNEDKPALAENFTVYYEQGVSGSWVQPSSVEYVDYGNGTYQLSFTAESTNDPLQTSLRCMDTRGISIWANATCTQG